MNLWTLLLLTSCAFGGKFHGTPPEAPISAPEFTATASDGTPRTRANLLGKTTVMWFYPSAATFL